MLSTGNDDPCRCRINSVHNIYSDMASCSCNGSDPASYNNTNNEYLMAGGKGRKRKRKSSKKRKTKYKKTKRPSRQKRRTKKVVSFQKGGGIFDTMNSMLNPSTLIAQTNVTNLTNNNQQEKYLV
jgi:hypothetical protein